MTGISDRIASIYDRITREPLNPVWISLVPEEEALSRARTLERSDDGKNLPLCGVPFAVSDLENLAVAARLVVFSIDRLSANAPCVSKDPLVIDFARCAPRTRCVVGNGVTDPHGVMRTRDSDDGRMIFALVGFP